VFEIELVGVADCEPDIVLDKLTEPVSERVGCTDRVAATDCVCVFEIVFDPVADTVTELEPVPDLDLDLVFVLDLDLERERDLLRVFVGLGPSEPSFVSVFD